MFVTSITCLGNLDHPSKSAGVYHRTRLDVVDTMLESRVHGGRVTMQPSGTCEFIMADGQACGKPTNQIFPDGSRQYWFCEDHLRKGGEKVIGRPFKDSPELEK